ncbi:succinate dehydrogenase assembly factor 2 [Palleronia sp.]|uniref:succinate dehydrogenase assembly factor 2 n=1 Tax=Palleronia sp. TaxID=1940284 RepID=UPI0035C84D3D
MSVDETTLRRLKMRSMRRGIREMDLILSGWAETRLAALSPEEVATYEALLSENDQDLYRWVSGQQPAPPVYADLVADIATLAHERAISAKN